MAALVQTLPQQTTITMLHGTPSSPSGFSPSHSSQQQSQKSPNSHRYHKSSGSGSYRGVASTGLTPSYAFTTTPQLKNATNSSRAQDQNAKLENRISSAPVLPQIPSVSSHRISLSTPLNFSASSFSNTPETSLQGHRSLDASPRLDAGHTKIDSNSSQFSTDNPTVDSSVETQQIPDRYRRNIRRVESGESGPNRVFAMSAVSAPAWTVTPGHGHTSPNSSPSGLASSYRGAPYQASNHARNISVEDMSASRPQNIDEVRTLKRRSLPGVETAGLNHANDTKDTDSPHPTVFMSPSGQQVGMQEQRNLGASARSSSHIHQASMESISSTRSPRPGSGHSDAPSSPRPLISSPAQVASMTKPDVKIVHIPQRAADSSRRNPSPLSRPDHVTESTPAAVDPKPVNPLQPGQTRLSPAAQHLAALNQADSKKPKSRFRRAFSFGSATELRKATAQNNLERHAAANPPPNPTSNPKRNSKYEDELDPEEAKIARRQEAGGIGESIYSGQGHFFTGSTDNLSVSSTASSASLMLRKMGKGVKKSTRSLVGLFRPKSVIGVPAADGPINQGLTGQVSMINVEAEREKVNVNPNPHDQPGGGTGFPKLERNSLDTKKSTESGRASSDARSRRSIVGGERERAEILAAVKKGILKRSESGQSSPVTKSYDFKVPDFNLPHIPHVNDSPRSSAPSTPADDHPPRSGHRRTDSIAIEGAENEDYFSSITQYTRIDSKSAPPTPRGTVARNISFSPRIQFHDTWPPAEYDRRGDVATCNRLTPMLAQQIKEELNTFKMEMEVHESSKVYTHFF